MSELEKTNKKLMQLWVTTTKKGTGTSQNNQQYRIIEQLKELNDFTYENLKARLLTQLKNELEKKMVDTE